MRHLNFTDRFSDSYLGPSPSFPPLIEWNPVLNGQVPRIFNLTSCIHINPFQSNFSTTHILPSSYLFWAGKRLVDYL
jgi:hypothetical protein